MQCSNSVAGRHICSTRRCSGRCTAWQDKTCCSVAQHSVAQHIMAQHTTTQQSTAWHSAAQHCTVWESTARDSTAQHSTAQHSTAQHSTAQHSTAQHSTAQHSTAQHTPDGGLVIHGCHRQQEIGDVSNVHSQLKVAARKLTHMQGVVYVFAAGRVNATDGQMPQVFPVVSASFGAISKVRS